VTAAAKANYLDPSSVSQAVRYGYRIIGMRWEYANGPKPGYKPGYVKNRRVQREDGTVYENVQAASKATGIKTSTLYCAITKFAKAGGYYWRYLND
jgi:hypothetical protein